jgi:hypothetical protein
VLVILLHALTSYYKYRSSCRMHWPFMTGTGHLAACTDLLWQVQIILPHALTFYDKNRSSCRMHWPFMISTGHLAACIDLLVEVQGHLASCTVVHIFLWHALLTFLYTLLIFVYSNIMTHFSVILHQHWKDLQQTFLLVMPQSLFWLALHP